MEWDIKHAEEMRYATNFSRETAVDLGVGWRMLLKCIFKKQNEVVNWIRHSKDKDQWWVAVNTVNKSSNSLKGEEISCHLSYYYFLNKDCAARCYLCDIL